MKIKNFKELATNQLRGNILSIVEEGFQAVDTPLSIKQRISLESDKLVVKGREFSLSGIQNIFLVGVGKSSLAAAEALEKKMGEKLKGGVVLDTKEESSLRKVEYFQGDHPYPTERNERATKRIIEFLKQTDEKDLVIFVISGGGSSLLCQPTDFNVPDEQNIIHWLFRVGADIQEINTVRKHLSLARGGNLAMYAFPSSSVSLIFSDVPGDNLEFVASGPTVMDSTTIEEAKNVLMKYNLWQKTNIGIRSFIETPKKKKYFDRVNNILFISNKTALQGMSEKANQLGFSSQIADTQISGEAREVGELIVSNLKDELPSTAVFYGGETTVTIKGDGVGGRNQETALSALRTIGRGCVVASVASDGVDNTEYAGAIADVLTREKAQKIGLKPEAFLQNNDAYNFFNKVEDYIYTSPTGSNVADLIIGLKL